MILISLNVMMMTIMTLMKNRIRSGSEHLDYPSRFTKWI